MGEPESAAESLGRVGAAVPVEEDQGSTTGATAGTGATECRAHAPAAATSEGRTQKARF